MSLPELASDRRLGRLIRAASVRAAAVESSTCELCAVALGDEHRHLLDGAAERLRCVCRACSLLFDRRGAGGDRFRLVPDACRLVPDFVLDDERWAALAIPVGLAYFVRSSAAGRVVAYYPGAMGAVESLLGLDAWAAIEDDNPVLARLEPDVEALLVRRLGERREHWLVPIDTCFRLVAVFRTRWRGLAGGSEVWQAIGEFFDDLSGRARHLDRRGRRL